MLRFSLSLIVLLAGCGGNGARSDAASGDAAAIDSITNDSIDAAVPGLVSLIVYDWAGPPMPNQPVAFQNADGSVVAVTMTDAQGMASATMVAGGSVSARRSPRPGYAGDWVYTFVDVKPGDQLVVGIPTAPTPPATFTASFALPYSMNAYDYQVFTKCGAGGASQSGTPVAQVTLSCSPVDVYVTARDNTFNHFTLAAFYKPAVTVTANATIDLTAETYLAVADVPVKITSLPEYVNQVNLSAALYDGTFSFESVVGGQSPGTPPPGEIDGLVRLPPIAGIDLLTFVTLQHRSSGSGASPYFVEEVRHLVPFSGSDSVDASTTLIEWVPFDAGVDPLSQRLFWAEDPGALTADFVRAEVSVAYISNGMPVRFVREIAGPHTGSELVLPMLPGPLAAYNFTADRTNGASLFFMQRFPGGWDAVRSHVFQFRPVLGQAGQTAVASTSGTAVIYP